MTQQLKQYNDSIKSRPGQRVYRVRRGTFHSQQCVASMEGQTVQGSEPNQHVLFHGVGGLEPLLLSPPKSGSVLFRRSGSCAHELYLAGTDVEVPQEQDDYGNYFDGGPCPY